MSAPSVAGKPGVQAADPPAPPSGAGGAEAQMAAAATVTPDDGADTSGSAPPTLQLPWKDIDWDDVMDGKVCANHYFMRSGLVRKDAVAQFTKGLAPPTFLVRSIDVVQARVKAGHAKAFAAQSAAPNVTGWRPPHPCAVDVAPADEPQAWVMKLPASSNAHGMRFFRSPWHRREDAEPGTRLAGDAAVGSASRELPAPRAAPTATAAPTPTAAATSVPGNGSADPAAGARLSAPTSGGRGSGDDDDDDDDWMKRVHPALRGIKLEMDAFTEATPRSKRLILQPYVNPALVRGRKFHIRALVLAVGSLQVFFHRHCRVLVASDAFSWTDMGNVYCHVSNRGVNQRRGDYDAATQDVDLDALDGDMTLPLSPAVDESTAAPASHPRVATGTGASAALLRQMHGIVGELFARLQNSGNRRHFFTLPNCFEAFGFDFVVDAGGRCWLLEVNADPSLSMFHAKTFADLVPDPFAMAAAADDAPERAGWDVVYTDAPGVRGSDASASGVGAGPSALAGAGGR